MNWVVLRLDDWVAYRMAHLQERAIVYSSADFVVVLVLGDSSLVAYVLFSLIACVLFVSN